MRMQLEWKKVESLLITSSLSRLYFLEEKQWVSDCWGGREHFYSLKRKLCTWEYLCTHVSLVWSWLLIARSLLASHLIMVEAISLPLQHLKKHFWISTHCSNPLQTSNVWLSL